MLSLALSALLAAAPAAAGAGEKPLSPADERFGTAGALFARGRFPEAARAYAAFARRFPADPRAPEAAFRSAESSYRAGRSKEAHAAFERCLELKLPAGRLAAARLRIGAGLYARGDSAGAAAALAKMSIKALPAGARPAAHYFLGASRLALGRKKEALPHLEKAAASSRAAMAAPALLALARLASGAGRDAQAAKHLERLLKKFPTSPEAPEAKFRMAEFLRLGGKAAAALPLYAEVLRSVKPGKLAARAALGAAWGHLEKGQASKALKMADLAGREPALKVEGMYVGGLARMAAGRYAEAEKAFAELVKADPRGARAEPASCRLVWCRHLAGRGARVGLAAREFRARFPKSRMAGEVAYVEGLAAAASGDLKGALEALDSAAAAGAKGPYAAESAYRAALLCMEKLRAGEARARLERLVKAHPKHRLADPALVKLGELHLAAGDGAGAARRFERHLAAFPKSRLRPAALLGRALAAARAADWAGFSSRCGQIVSAHPGDPRAAEAAYWLAWNHERLKAYDRAVAAYRALIKEHKNSPLVYEFKFRLCCAYYLNGNYPKAAEGFLVLARSGKRGVPAETLLWLGQYLGGQKRAGEAAEVYALAAGSKDPGTREEARLALGHLASRRGRPAEAVRLYRRLLEEFPGSARAQEARLGLARALRLAGKPGEVAAVCAKLAASGSERIRLAARGELALAALASGRAAAARKDLLPLVVLYHDGDLVPGWLAALAQAEEKLSGKAAARRWRAELIRRYPASPQAAAASRKTGIPLPEVGKRGEDF